jgi:hypothetical protein
VPRERAFGTGLDPDPPARIGFQTKGRRSGFRKGASNRRTASKANPRSPGGKRGGAIRRLLEGEIGAPVTGTESGPLRCSCAAPIAWGFPGIPPVTIPPPGPGDRNRPKSLGRQDVPLPQGQRKGPDSGDAEAALGALVRGPGDFARATPFELASGRPCGVWKGPRTRRRPERRRVRRSGPGAGNSAPSVFCLGIPVRLTLPKKRMHNPSWMLLRERGAFPESPP